MSSNYVANFHGKFEAVVDALTGAEFRPTDSWVQPKESLVAVIGFTGAGRGTVQLQLDLQTADAISALMNGEPLSDRAEMMLFIGELANTFCGRAISCINQQRADGRYWLTPPVVFAGGCLEVTAPGLQAEYLHYQSSLGGARIKICFEGV